MSKYWLGAFWTLGVVETGVPLFLRSRAPFGQESTNNPGGWSLRSVHDALTLLTTAGFARAGGPRPAL